MKYTIPLLEYRIRETLFKFKHKIRKAQKVRRLAKNFDWIFPDRANKLNLSWSWKQENEQKKNTHKAGWIKKLKHRKEKVSGFVPSTTTRHREGNVWKSFTSRLYSVQKVHYLTTNDIRNAILSPKGGSRNFRQRKPCRFQMDSTQLFLVPEELGARTTVHFVGFNSARITYSIMLNTHICSYTSISYGLLHDEA